MGSSTASARTDVRPALLKRLGENSCLDKQRDKIREIGQALRQAGFVGLDKQAKALGLCRSTTWTILQGDHKTSGLNAKLIHRMLSRDELPTAVRVLLREYVLE